MKLSVSESIRAPIGEVFAALTDLESYADRIPAIQKVEVLTDGEVRVGTRFRETRVMFGKQASETMEFTELDPPRGYLLEAHSHGAHYLTRHTLTEQGDVTVLEMSFEGRPETAMARVMTTLMGWMMKGSMRRALTADLAALKQSLEEG